MNGTLRSLARAPSFTGTAVAALAVGLGASTALFSVLDGVLFRPLPFPAPDQLMTVYARTAAGDLAALSYAEFVDWRAQMPPSVQRMAFSYGNGARFRTKHGASSALIDYASEDFFPMMATRPQLGRLPLPEEQVPGAALVLVLSDGMWRREFNADAGIIGRAIDTNRGSFTIIGVMPPSFQYPDWAECWTPIAPMLARTPALAGRNYRVDNRILLRLAPGVTSAKATADLSVTATRLGTQYREDAGLLPVLSSLEEETTSDIRPALLIFTAAVSVLLIIACANVATLTMVRGTTRSTEFAVRAALGAGKGRIARLVIAESAVIAATGGILGLALAWAAVRSLLADAPLALPRTGEIAIDWKVVAFTTALGAITPLVFGLAPVLQATRFDLVGAMRRSSRGAGGGRSDRRVRAAFTAAQIAMSLVLLVGAGLLGRSFLAISATTPGYDPRGLVEVRVDGLEEKNNTPEKLVAFYGRVRDAVAAVPGTERVGLIYSLPPSRIGIFTRLQPAGFHYDVGRSPHALYQPVDAGYFATVRQPILRGRGFTAADMNPSSRAIVITANVAARLWPGEDPIGKPLRVFKQAPGRADTDQPLDEAVIGVVGDVKFSSLADSATPEVYLPMPVNPWRNTFVVARTASEPAAYIRAMRHALAAVDPDINVADISTVTQMLSETLEERRFYMLLLAAFAASALLLATIGVYGVVAFGLTQRRHEIGVRTALGARRASLLVTFVREGMGVAVVGILLGIPVAVWATRLLESMLYGVRALDAATFVAVAILLLLVAAVASFLPARRLTRVDPAEALRSE